MFILVYGIFFIVFFTNIVSLVLPKQNFQGFPLGVTQYFFSELSKASAHFSYPLASNISQNIISVMLSSHTFDTCLLVSAYSGLSLLKWILLVVVLEKQFSIYINFSGIVHWRLLGKLKAIWGFQFIYIDIHIYFFFN